MECLIVAFAFGTRAELPANRLLAEVAHAEAGRQGVQVLTQRNVNLFNDARVTYVEDASGEPPSTLRIARAAARMVKRNPSVRRVCIVAADPHYWRCQRDVRFALAEAGISGIHVYSSGAEALREQRWFLSGPSEEGAWLSAEWWSRELLVRCMPMPMYCRVIGLSE